MRSVKSARKLKPQRVLARENINMCAKTALSASGRKQHRVKTRENKAAAIADFLMPSVVGAGNHETVGKSTETLTVVTCGRFNERAVTLGVQRILKIK